MTESTIEGLGRPACRTLFRDIRQAVSARLWWGKALPTAAVTASQAFPDDSDTGDDGLPPEPAWVEMSRAFWL